MCIVCNVKTDTKCAHDFQVHHYSAYKEMQKAANDMLLCSKNAINPKVAKQYDREHKKMVRMIKAWNSIEHTRELEHVSAKEG